ncbi:MAG: hypothetical protein H8E57_08615 [Candidatus Cloacimonetes bacterium]|nr:hypothetical protein [Candidatus Cloacimonadota bacterium]
MRFSLLIIILLIVSCSDVSSSEEINTYKITDILDNIVLAFNFNDIEDIMKHFHPDFLHNGDDLEDEELVWVIRLNEYDEIRISNIVIDILSEESVIVSFQLIFIIDGIEENYDEPSEQNGDLSYFHKDFEDWRILGNQDNVLNGN